MAYIATFYSHFDAIRFHKRCQRQGLEARLMPVPRTLSSSCGTCVRCQGPLPGLDSDWLEGVEQVVREGEGGYQPLYRAENG